MIPTLPTTDPASVRPVAPADRHTARVAPPRRPSEPEVASTSQAATRRPTVSAVIPTLNEARNLPHVLGALPAIVDEVVIVDGRSTDDTVAVARRLRPDAVISTQPGRGKGDALAHGFALAGGEILVTLDADGSTRPEEIGDFVDALCAGADFVKGSRFLPDGGSTDLTALRRLGNRTLVGMVNTLHRTNYTDLCYGYNAFWRRCLPAIDVNCPGFEVETLMNIRAARAGLVVTEVPSQELERIHGSSNLNAGRDGWRVLRTILRELRTPRPGTESPVLRPAFATETSEGDAA